MALGTYRQLCRELSLAEFARRRSWPLLVHDARTRGPLKPLHTQAKTIDRLVIEEAAAGIERLPEDPYTVFELVPVGDQERVTVGSARYCDACVNDVSVSRVHAFVIRHGATYTVQDAESAAGTFLNDELLENGVSRDLRSGDRLAFGNVEVVFFTAADFHGFVRGLP